ncbi:MAG: ABC transporter ATP-binding protein [Candidatus Krumholzibacteriota bacterium]|nr:ABC transporter ATP-binding protein [Candidatus Krumholzibacteriota bacterium]
MLEVRGLSKKLGDFQLDDISFTVETGEYFVLLGASGTGKTVLLETLTGIIRADRGTITHGGIDITDEKIQKRKIAIVFQDQALFPHMSVRQNLAYSLRARGIKGAAEAERISQLARSMEIEPLLDRRPGALSGGEAQRVALARALASEPDCILLDEPLSSLDSNTRKKIRAILRRLNRNGITIIHVTHDYEEAISLAVRIGVMERGSIVQVDTPENILRHPKSEFVAGFVGIKNFFRGKIRRGASGAQPEFITGGANFTVSTDIAGGDAFAIIRSEDIVLTSDKPSHNDMNILSGRVTDISRVRSGIEIVVDSDVEISAVIPAQRFDDGAIGIGSDLYLSFGADQVRIMEV